MVWLPTAPSWLRPKGTALGSIDRMATAIVSLPEFLVRNLAGAPVQAAVEIVAPLPVAALSPTFSALPVWGGQLGGAVGGAFSSAGEEIFGGKGWLIPAAILGGVLLLRW